MPFRRLRLGPFNPRPATTYPDAPAQNPTSGTSGNHPNPPEPAAATRQADLIPLTDLEPRPIDWLWQDRLAAGSLAMLSGDPGSGKTWIVLAIAAALSRGRVPSTIDPDDTREPCTVLYASTHNGGSELVRPRFASLNGDPARLILLRGVLAAGSAQPASLSLRDTPMLEDALERTHARLLIIDPLHSYLWTADRHRANHASRLFDDLDQLAEKHRCCILLVRHLRKRGPGPAPIELSAAVRTAFLAGSSPDAPTRSGLVQVKSNLGRLAPSVGYTIDDTGAFSCAFSWTGPSKLTPEEVTAGRPIGAGLPSRKLAAEWLRQHLSSGARTQYNIETAAQLDGVCITTLRRAKFDLGIASIKESISGPWLWTLPENNQPATQRHT
jgi:hypothetical protein